MECERFLLLTTFSLPWFDPEDRFLPLLYIFGTVHLIASLHVSASYFLLNPPRTPEIYEKMRLGSSQSYP